MRPPRPSDLGTTSWSKALDLYLASYDASGHAEFSGGVSARVAPAAPVSGALPVSEPRAFRAPLALVDDNRGDREIRRRLNERLTRGTRVSERRGRRDAAAHPRARALGWSRDSATRLDDARLDVSETRADARTADARGDAGDRGDRGESPKRRGSWRSDAVSASRRDAAARGARGARRPPPPPRRSRSASSGRWSPGRASASSPSASSASSSSTASSREEEEEEEEVFAASTREKAKAREISAENPPVSPEARAAARVDALLAGLGVVVFSPDADRRHARAAAEPPRRIAPAPGSAPRAASSARGRRALARDSEIGDSITTGFNKRGASSGTSGTSPSSSDSDVGGSDAESSSGYGSGAGSTRSRSSAREAPKHKKPERDRNAGDDRNALGSRERAASGTGGGTELGANEPGSNPGGAFFGSAASFGSAAEQAAFETRASVRRAAEDLEDVSSATSGSISDGGSEGSPAAVGARRARGDFLAEQVRLSLAALEQIRETHSLPASPPESPGAAERAAARAARRARRASGELDALDALDAGAAAATLFLDALEPAAAPPPASPSGLTGAARVRVMYPELFA